MKATLLARRRVFAVDAPCICRRSRTRHAIQGAAGATAASPGPAAMPARTPAAAGPARITDPVQLVPDSFSAARSQPELPRPTSTRSGSWRRANRLRLSVRVPLGPRHRRCRGGRQHRRQHHVGCRWVCPAKRVFNGARISLPADRAYRIRGDRWLPYVKGGVAWASDSYSVAGTLPARLDFEGLDCASAGPRAPASNGRCGTIGRSSSNTTITASAPQCADVQFTNVLSGPVNIKQNIQVVKAGLNFHVWWGQ